jgi:hypothetical protein
VIDERRGPRRRTPSAVASPPGEPVGGFVARPLEIRPGYNRARTPPSTPKPSRLGDCRRPPRSGSFGRKPARSRPRRRAGPLGRSQGDGTRISTGSREIHHGGRGGPRRGKARDGSRLGEKPKRRTGPVAAGLCEAGPVRSAPTACPPGVADPGYKSAGPVRPPAPRNPRRTRRDCADHPLLNSLRGPPLPPW